MNDDQLYYNAGEDIDTLFDRVDTYGGWPQDKRYLIMQHVVGLKRPCYFSTVSKRNSYNTTLYNSDKYYWWKISKGGQISICNTMVDQLRPMLETLRYFQNDDNLLRDIDRVMT